ncbi:MAG: hypothetical protein JWN72_581 [Thermoleophilia bacterium]|nr:hypothetical protein [Thermoleophilia bacterium]
MTGSIAGSGSALPNVSAPSTTASGDGSWHKQGFYEDDAPPTYGEVVRDHGMEPGQKRLSEAILGGSFAAIGAVATAAVINARVSETALSGLAKFTRIGGGAVAGALALGALGFGVAKVMQHFDSVSNHVPQRLTIDPRDSGSRELIDGSSAPAAFARREFGIDSTRTPEHVTDAVLATYDTNHDGALDIGVETDAANGHGDVEHLARAADLIGDGTQEQEEVDGVATKAEIRHYAELVAGLTEEEVEGVSVRDTPVRATAVGYLSDRDVTGFLAGDLPSEYYPIR